MKAALITEEQIKAIEDALIPSTGIFLDPTHRVLAIAALAIVKSLKVQEPVAWKKTAEGIESTRYQQLAEKHGFNIPLYAGEQP